MTSKYLGMTSVSWLYPVPPLRGSLPLAGTAVPAWLARPGRLGAEGLWPRLSVCPGLVGGLGPARGGLRGGLLPGEWLETFMDLWL